MDELLVTLFVIVAIAYFIARNGRFVYLSSKIPGPSMWEILTIHAKRLLSDEFLIHAWKMCESRDFKPWGLWLYNYYSVIVSDQDTISEVFKSQNLFDKTSLMYSAVACYLGDGLISLNGEDYRRHRKIMIPAFRQSLLEAQLPTVNEDATMLVEEIRRNVAESTGAVGAHPLIEYRSYSLSLSIFSSSTFVYHNIKKIPNAIKMCLPLVHLRTLNPFYYWFLKIFSKSFRQTEAMAEGILDEFKEDFLNQKVVEITGLCEDSKPSNVKECLLRSNMNGEQGISNEEFFHETGTILAASSETTTVGTIVTLLMLALHQDVQQRVFDEMESIFGQNHRSVEMEDISRMVYLGMVIKEALRLFPPSPMIGRYAEKETELNGVVIPKGTSVFINMFALHRNPNVFKDPLKFDPERFSPEMCDKRHPYAYLPFSSGFRQCPGQLQAMAMIKTFLCYIVRNFKVYPSDGIKCLDDVHIKMEVVLHLPKYSLRFVSREIK